MGQNSRRQREQMEVRERILEAARGLFAERGYEAVTMRAVAEKVEYSPTALYLHFPSKEALIQELCSRDFLALAEGFRAMGTQPQDPRERIRAIGRAFLEFGISHPNHYRLLFMSPQPPIPAEARSIRRGSLEEDAWAMLVSAVAEAQAEGRIASSWGAPEAVAQQLFAGIHGVVSLHLARGGDPWIAWTPVREAGERMLQALLRAYGEAAP